MVIYAPTNESTEVDVTVKSILHSTPLTITNTDNIAPGTEIGFSFQLEPYEYTLDSGEKIDPLSYPKAKMIVKVFEDVEDVEDGKCLNEKEFTDFEFSSNGHIEGTLSYEDLILDSDGNCVMTDSGNYKLIFTVYQYVSDTKYEKYFVYKESDKVEKSIFIGR